jgi:hypothetical protein
LDQLSYYPALLARAAALHQQGLSRGAIAEGLNAEGWRPAKRRQTFTADMVRSLLVRQGLSSSKTRPRSVTREADEWTLPALAYTLEMPPDALCLAAQRASPGPTRPVLRAVVVSGRCERTATSACFTPGTSHLEAAHTEGIVAGINAAC